MNSSIQQGLNRVLDAAPVSVDLWVLTGGCADFKREYDKKLIACQLHREHNGNRVFATGKASQSGDAFMLAIEQIEKTIGREWRIIGATA